MRYIFSIFCFSINQAKVLNKNILKIQLQTIKLTNIIENQTGVFTNYNYILNVLCELTTTKFMEKAIQETIFEVNKLEIIPILYEQEFKLNIFPNIKVPNPKYIN